MVSIGYSASGPLTRSWASIRPIVAAREGGGPLVDSRRLALRERQPGHDQTYRRSERDFITALIELLDERTYEIVDHPTDLLKVFRSATGGRDLGIRPEASIRNRETGRVMYFEVKKQGPRGNAEERACKHHTVRFSALMREVAGVPYHPFSTIFCESLATDPRYTTKFPFLFEELHYFPWVDYRLDLLESYLAQLRSTYLEPALVTLAEHGP